MTSDLDIYRSANVLVTHHGEGTPSAAAGDTKPRAASSCLRQSGRRLQVTRADYPTPANQNSHTPIEYFLMRNNLPTNPVVSMPKTM